MLDSKDEEAYYHLFGIIKNIADGSGTIDWKLRSVTLDFEAALINAFSRVLTESRVIGCLFHFKQALYRQAQAFGITKETLKEETKKVVRLLGSFCWTGDHKVIDKKLEKLEEDYKDTDQHQLIIYYKDNWLQKLKSGLIDYSDIEDEEFRSNSILEQYQSHVKDCLPRSSSWPQFIDFLVNEEDNYVKDSFRAEQRGQVAVRSVNFGQTYLPKTIKKLDLQKRKGLQNASETKESLTTAQKVPQAGYPPRTLTDKRKIRDYQSGEDLDVWIQRPNSFNKKVKNNSEKANKKRVDIKLEGVS